VGGIFEGPLFCLPLPALLLKNESEKNKTYSQRMRSMKAQDKL
jgi:hypothetical protein